MKLTSQRSALLLVGATINAAMTATMAAAEEKLLQMPVLPHHHILQRNNRNLQLSEPGTTSIHNIPHVRKFRFLGGEGGEDEDSSQDSEIEVGELFQGYGTHYVDLWIGTPPQRQTVIVDTGSGVTAFPCVGCVDCGQSYHASAYFNEQNSQTFEKIFCNDCSGGSCRSKDTKNEFCAISVSYQEGSMWAAYEAKDMTYFGGLHDEPLEIDEEGEHLGGKLHGEDPMHAPEFSFEMVFGCQNKITGLFKTQLADGIMGMCLKSSAVFEQMYRQKVIERRSFSLCFVRGDDAAKDGTVAGALTMGGTDNKLHLSPMIYAKGFPTKGVMHGVRIRKVHLMEAGVYGADEATADNVKFVGVSEDQLNVGSVIVDSGTTDTYMTRTMAAEFQNAFKMLTGFKYNEHGMTLTEDQVHELPTILIQLVGADGQDDGVELLPGHANLVDPEHPQDILLAIPPAHYVEFDPDAKKYVGRFSTTEARGSVLGANAMRGHDVYFDIPSNKRIGFATSDCDYRSLIGLDVAVAGVASGQEHKPDDDYYESENLTKFESNNDTTDPSASDPGNLFQSFGVVEIGIVAGIIAAAFTIFKAVSNRKRARTEAESLEKEHLKELHLDTEIQMTELS